MGWQYCLTNDWRAFDSGLQKDVEASAAHILQRIGPATVDRIENLVTLALAEGASAPPPQRAETAFALAAELKRRARLMTH